MTMALALAALLWIPVSPAASQHGGPGAKSGPAISGTVAETMDSGGYTYVRLKSGKDSVWAAVPPMKVKVGQQLSLEAGMEMRNFTSKTLKRTFKSIYFCNGPAGTADPHTQVTDAHAGTPAMPVEQGLKIEKAPGGVTIEELYRRRKELDGRKVAVRGKVVKVSPQIMDRNWVHLQDGTGDPKAGTHDLTVGTKEMPVIGSVVVIQGTARKDKSFGMGYDYKVILEDGSVSK